MIIGKQFQPDAVIGKETMAYVLNAAKYNHKTREIVATDGKCLVVRKFSKEEVKGMDETALIPREVFVEARKSKKGCLGNDIEVADGKVKVIQRSKDREITYIAVEGRFPDHERCLPDNGKKHILIGIPVTQLAKIVKCYGGDGSVVLRVPVADDGTVGFDGPLFVKSVYGGSFDTSVDRAAVMPIKCYTGDDEMPVIKAESCCRSRVGALRQRRKLCGAIRR